MKDDKPNSRTIEDEVKELEGIFQKRFGKAGPVKIFTDVVYPKKPMSAEKPKSDKPKKKYIRIKI